MYWKIRFFFSFVSKNVFSIGNYRFLWKYKQNLIYKNNTIENTSKFQLYFIYIDTCYTFKNIIYHIYYNNTNNSIFTRLQIMVICYFYFNVTRKSDYV